MFSERMKRMYAALLVCALLFSLASAAVAEGYPSQGHIQTPALMRRSPSESSEAVMIVPAGDAVYVTGESGSYYIVEYDGTTGYVAKSQLVLDNGQAINVPLEEYAARYAILYQGNEGQIVSDLQTALIELGYLSGTADGKYGAKTAQAVAAFQQQNGLSTVSSADAATQGLLFEGKPLNARGRAQSVSVVPTIEGFSVTQGRSGTLVRSIQASLQELGYYTGKLDGKYGASTVSAVKKFQKKNGLSATGTADAATQALLNGDPLSASATATPAPTASAAPAAANTASAAQAEYPFETVTVDSVNLRKRPSTSSARLLTIPKGATVTVSALQGDFLEVSYQTSRKSYVGYVMARYVDIPAIYLGGKALAEDAEAQKNYGSLSQGASGTAVGTLQDALKELGFFTTGTYGMYDDATVAAVKAFQSRNGLLQTGIASAELQKLIYEGRPMNSLGRKVSVAVLPPLENVTMRSGDTGYQVSALQQSLKEMGYYEGTVSGAYDAATAKAVRAFQKARGLTVDGVAGPKVLAALENAAGTPAPVVAAVAATATPAPITADNVIILHRGTRGQAVTRLQERLVSLGYYAVTPDGVYDADDIEAVRLFQKMNNLTVDGVAGLETQQRRFAAYAVPAWATATPAPATAEALRIGASGDAVRQLQTRLAELNYLTDSVDGNFGTKTAAAVAAFQRANGLTADGVAGEKTLQTLYASGAKSAAATATAAPTANQNMLLRIGDTGESVKGMQRLLISLGYLSGAADGIFGTKTYLALQAFQQDYQLTVDGMAGPDTLARLDQVSQTKGSTSGGSLYFKAPQAREVRFADWYNEIRAQAKLMPNAIIYDYNTGLYYHLKMFSFGKHCDAEPVTASDTAAMYQIMGESDWTPHAVWVILSDGKVYMASTHSHGHEIDHNPNNDLEGHICIHFPREMTAEEKRSMPYAVSHQQEILRGWEETQSLIR